MITATASSHGRGAMKTSKIGGTGVLVPSNNTLPRDGQCLRHQKRGARTHHFGVGGAASRHAAPWGLSTMKLADMEGISASSTGC